MLPQLVYCYVYDTIVWLSNMEVSNTGYGATTHVFCVHNSVTTNEVVISVSQTLWYYPCLRVCLCILKTWMSILNEVLTCYQHKQINIGWFIGRPGRTRASKDDNSRLVVDWYWSYIVLLQQGTPTTSLTSRAKYIIVLRHVICKQNIPVLFFYRNTQSKYWNGKHIYKRWYELFIRNSCWDHRGYNVVCSV
jgi:hypothetical protein